MARINRFLGLSIFLHGPGQAAQLYRDEIVKFGYDSRLNFDGEVV